MRRFTGILAVALVAAACGGGSSDSTTSSTTSAITGSTTSSSSSTTAAPGSTTTSAVPLPQVGAEVLVAGPEGVFVVRADGSTELLIDSPAVFAIDDLDGGVLFQIERWARDRGSVVYRVRREAGEIIDTLVPARDQGLALNGIAAADDTRYVYYTRSEGSTVDDARETFRRYDLGTREVAELRTTGGWESGSFPISVSETLVLFNWQVQASHGMDFSDLEGNAAAVAGDPDPPGEEFQACLRLCPSLGELSTDGSQLVYVEEEAGVAYAVVRHLASGAEIRRIELAAGGDWWVASFDLSRDHLVVNRESTAGMLPAWVYDLSRVRPEPVALPVAGEGYLTRSTVDVNGPVPGR